MPRLAALAIVLASGAASAKDYPPARCGARQPYQGRPLRDPVEPSLPGDIPAAPLPPATAAKLDRAFDAVGSLAHAPALGVAVGRIGEGLWSRGALPPATPRLWWASVGKLFVATVVLQLVEERRLSLDDPVSRWITGVPNGDVVTVRDLLAHTSGLFSANEDLRVHARPHHLPPNEMLAILQRHGAMFCPSANWRYSNSGYDLLAAIVGRIDGRPLAQAIEARILRPLGLSSIIALQPGIADPRVAPSISVKEAAIQSVTAGAGGPIAGDPADMVRFLEALLGGRLLPAETVRTMFRTLYPMFDPGTFYGLGVMAIDVPDGDRRDLWLGHAGGAPGASAMLIWSPTDRAIVAVALTGDVPAAAVANAMLKALRTGP